MPENRRDQVAEGLLDTQQRVGDAVAQGLTRDPTMGRLSAERERKDFWERAISPEQEALLWQQGVDPWEISTRVFPKRWQLMGQGRTTDTEKVDWLKKHQALGPPTRDVTADEDAGPSLEAPTPAPAAAGVPFDTLRASLGAPPAMTQPSPPARLGVQPQAAGGGYPSVDDPALGYG